MNGAAKKYYPWVICLGCLLAQFVVTGLVCNLLGSYFPYMQTELGFTNTQTSSFLTVRSISNGFCALFLKKFYDRLGARKGLSLSVITAGIVFAALSVNRSYALGVVLVTILGATISLGGIYGVTVAVTKWFRTETTTAIAIAGCGSGFATMLVSSPLTEALESGGLAAGFRLAAGISVVCALFIFLTMRDLPSDDTLVWAAGRGKQASAAERVEAAAESSAAARRRPPRILVIIAVLLGCTASNCTIVHMALLFGEKQFSPHMTAFAISALGVVLIITKFTYGAAVDRFGSRTVTIACCMLGFIGELMLAFLGAGSMVLTILAILLTCYGLIVASVGTPAITKDLCPPEAFGDMLKDLQAYPVLGPIALGTVPGHVADLTGSYVPSFVAFAVMLLLAGVIYWYCYRAAGQSE
ncbi:MAG: MFS transporter [Firmicutes bacterium]|nr:MFS transporter [Bacillota bacterium]